MSMTGKIERVEVMTSVQRRRRWSRAEKERIVAASLEPGAVASAVAREFGVHSSQVFRWRQQLCGRTDAAPCFAAVAITAEPRGPAAPPCGLIEIELSTGARVRISGAVAAATVSAVIAALTPALR